MDLAEIRQGVATLLEQIDGCRVFVSIPEALAASGITALVVAAGEPYVVYTEGAGRVNQNDINLRVVVVPPQQSGARNILAEIDALLSCGADQLRSIRTTLGTDISASGTACALSTLQAQIRTISINDMTAVVGEVELLVKARC